MKRQTAINNLNKIVDRVRSVNGIIVTPMCHQEFVKIKRIWVFGSVAKGSELPNDLDIFVEIRQAFDRCDQPRRKARRKMFRKTSKGLVMHGGYKCGGYSCGASIPINSVNEALKWLKQGTKKTSIHMLGGDRIFDRLDCKYLVYPRNDFTPTLGVACGQARKD